MLDAGGSISREYLGLFGVLITVIIVTCSAPALSRFHGTLVSTGEHGESIE